MLVRVAGPDDIPSIGDVFRAAGKAAWPHILPAEALDTLKPATRWLESAASGDGSVVVGEVEGEVVGFAVVRRSQEPDADESTGELDSFYTHPSVWGRGVGRALHDAALQKLRDQGFTKATVWTAEANHRPRRFYEAAGWQLDGVTRARTVHGADFVEVRYAIDLA